MARLEPKAAAETRNYTFDWATYLGTDTIASSVVTASGVTLDADTNDTTSVTVIVSGGTDGTVGRITNTITTADGLVETEIFTLRITNGEPVTLAEAKAQCKVLDDSKDGEIAGYIVSAREYVENYTGHILVRRTITEQRDSFGNFLELRWRPIASIDEIGYTDSGGAAATYAGFVPTAARYPARVYPATNDWWPTLGTNGEVTVAYTAGYAEGEVPAALTQAMLLLIAQWHTNAEASLAEQIKEAPFAVTALCDQYRQPLL